MAINLTATVKRGDLSQLDYTYALLSGLSDDELEAVQAVAIAFLKNNNKATSHYKDDTIVPFQAQTEKQLLARIDHSLEQIKLGNYQDSEEFEKELLEEIDG